MAYDFTYPDNILMAIEFYRNSELTAADCSKHARYRLAAQRRLVLGLPVIKEILRNGQLSRVQRDYLRKLIIRIEYGDEIVGSRWCGTVGATVTNLINRNILLRTGRTSIRLEPEMWDALAEVCRREGITPGDLAARATRHVDEGGRTSAIRTFIIKYFREASTQAGHINAGHGSLE